MSSDGEYAKYLAFYREFFETEEEALQFVVACEDREPLRHPSRLIMHQCQRLISVAREMGALRPKHHAVQIFWLLVCAEAVSKLHSGAKPSGGSRRAVRHFFSELLPEADQCKLTSGISGAKETALTSVQVADALYDVRCDVAHEGQYWSIVFSSDGVLTASPGWSLWTALSLEQMYEIIVFGCVAAARSRLEDDAEVPRKSHNTPLQRPAERRR